MSAAWDGPAGPTEPAPAMRPSRMSLELRGVSKAFGAPGSGADRGDRAGRSSRTGRAGRAAHGSADRAGVDRAGVDRGDGRRGALQVVASVDLVVRPGELVALIGPSGCGKSTLFNIVAGLEEPSEGAVLLDGEELPGRLGTSAYMPQHDALLAWRRVVDNVTLPLELQGVARRRARQRVLPLLERFGLAGFARAWPWQLSGGMRQRVAFLRTVVSERPLLLLDEPFGALDGITRADLQQWLSQVWAEYGSTVLLVTHDIAEAVFLADRIYVLTPRPGRIAAELAVDLPRPRRAALRETDAFFSLERRLRRQLQEAMAHGGEFAAPPAAGGR